MSREVIAYIICFRWHNHLDPSINKKQWSDLEEMQFV